MPATGGAESDKQAGVSRVGEDDKNSRHPRSRDNVTHGSLKCGVAASPRVFRACFPQAEVKRGRREASAHEHLMRSEAPC